eukprot:TRINITY_DN15792_c0_g1_i1.p1 TRINITY_DN15792_c0_g1~~TRINITY_DN15792_c0_g1_i1.p1  ORF type:complete len:483 (-),score=117.99 TRINITY_DN15792_c0_g1_i1:489-1937(-)
MRWTRVWNRIEANSNSAEELEHLRHDAKLRLWQNLFWDSLLRREFGCELTIMRVPSLPVFDEVEMQLDASSAAAAAVALCGDGNAENNNNNVNGVNNCCNGAGGGENRLLLHSLAAHEDSDDEEDEEEYGFEDYDVRRHDEDRQRQLVSFHGTAWERHCENKKLEYKIGYAAYVDVLMLHEEIFKKHQPQVHEIIHQLLWELNGVDVYWDGPVDDHPELEKSDYYFCIPKVREEVHNFIEQKREVREIDRKTKSGTPGFGTLRVTGFPFHAELLMENGDVCCFALYDQIVTVDDVISNERVTYRIHREFDQSILDLQHLLALNLSTEKVLKLREMRMQLRSLSGKTMKIRKSLGTFQVEQSGERTHPISVVGNGTVFVNISEGFICRFKKHKKNWVRRLLSKNTSPLRTLLIPELTLDSADELARKTDFSALSPYVVQEEVHLLSAAFHEARRLQAKEIEHKEEILPASFHVSGFLWIVRPS